jgi:hypothetical protein
LRWKGEGFGHAGRYRTGSRVGKEERRRLSSSSSEIAISRFWIAISIIGVKMVIYVGESVLMVFQREGAGGVIKSGRIFVMETGESLGEAGEQKGHRMGNREAVVVITGVINSRGKANTRPGEC